MKLVKFENDSRYIRAQQRTQRRRRKGKECFYENEFDLIKSYVNYEVAHVICHGAKYGGEVNRLANAFEESEVIGTDLFPQSDLVIEWDFRRPKAEWVNHFDLIYSNSLDHSDCPDQTVQTWLEQLTDSGLMFLQWTRYHTSTGSGDCFGAEIYEYYDLLNGYGTVEDILYAGNCAFLIVVNKMAERRRHRRAEQRRIESGRLGFTPTKGN